MQQVKFIDITGFEPPELKAQLVSQNLHIALADAVALFCLEELKIRKLDTAKEKSAYEKFTFQLLNQCQRILKFQGTVMEKGLPDPPTQ